MAYMFTRRFLYGMTAPVIGVGGSGVSQAENEKDTSVVHVDDLIATHGTVVDP